MVVHIKHVYTGTIWKLKVSKRQKKIKEISLDSSKFARIDIYKLHVLFWTPGIWFSIDSGHMNHETINVKFLFYIQAQTAWASIIEPVPSQLQENVSLKSVDFLQKPIFYSIKIFHKSNMQWNW